VHAVVPIRETEGHAMGFEKRASSEPGTVTVVFHVPPEADASSAEVLGEFTDWAPLAMQPSRDGGHEATIDLRGGSAYRFRYRLDGERWMNDWSADDYVPNDYGSDDSIIDLTTLDFAPEPPEVRPRASAPGRAGGTVKKAARKPTKSTKAQKQGATGSAEPAKRTRTAAKKSTAPKD
jgi:hypothetical protein